MQKIEINDNFNISDSLIKGYVEVRKEDGTILFKKHNMVMLSGRKHILNSLINGNTLSFSKIFFSNDSTSSESTMILDNFKYKYETMDLDNTNISYNTNENIPLNNYSYYLDGDTKKLKIGDTKFNNSWLDNEINILSISDNVLKFNNEDIMGTNTAPSPITSNSPFIKIQVLLDNTLFDNGTYNLSSLGLIYNDDGDDVLFSRVIFQPIVINSSMGTKYEISYYIYL